MSFIAISLIAIALTIVIGYKFKINYGIIAMVFAYIIGCFCMDLKAKEVIAMFPTSLFFTLFSITLFFSIGLANGTILLFTRKAIYPFRNKPAIIPIILFLIAALVAFTGPGAVPCFALLTPIYMSIAYEIGINRGLVPLMVVGASAGAWGPIASNGITTKNLIEAAGFEATAYGDSLVVWAMCAAFLFLIFLVFYFIFGGVKLKNTVNMEKPEAFNKEQKVTMTLIIIMLVWVIVPSILNHFIELPFLKTLSSTVSVEFVCIVLTFVALLIKNADIKKCFKEIPMPTIVMICGVGMLIQIAIQAGAVDALAGAITENVNPMLMPILFAVIGGVMSFFSSTIGVVMPTIFPLVAAIAAVVPSISAPIIFGCVVVGSVASGFSPFSTQGALTLANIKKGEEAEKEENKLFWELIMICIVALVLACIFSFAIANIF